MQASPADNAGMPPRPVPGSYWVLPGRFLVGEHPGSQSRADTMDRLRRFLRSGVTCFVDLTEARELPSYEGLLPFATPSGRRIEYVREPIPDHSVPAGRDTMSRLLATVEQALAVDHVVYLHCRAGIGRSAMAAGCWLAGRPGANDDPLERLQALWQQSSQSQAWPVVPETPEQAEFVRNWSQLPAPPLPTGVAPFPGAAVLASRIRGALLGLALGDAAGAARALKRPASAGWTQHTSLALCLAESLLEVGHCDARDQMERYLRWQHDGHLAARGQPGRATADVARALATYQWRGQPMAGSHDPADRSTASLPRVVSAVAWSAHDPTGAVALGSECSRTTHQSPIVLDACRYYAALLLGAFGGAPRAAVLEDLYEPVAGLWAARPLRPEVAAAAREPPNGEKRRGPADVIEALSVVRCAVAQSGDVTTAVERAAGASREPALAGALAGALMGAFVGAEAIPQSLTVPLPGLAVIEDFAARLATAGGGGR
jgi:ADP-ribosyl-[dinitrogen reductase] hydrolase